MEFLNNILKAFADPPEFGLLIAAFIMVAMAVLLPIPHFLWRAWPYRRDTFMSQFSEGSVKSYFELFFPSLLEKRSVKEGDYKNILLEHYNRAYGCRLFIVCYAIFMFLVLVGLGWITITIGINLKILNNKYPLPPMAVSAFMGGVMWVMFDQVRRCRSYDFTHHDVNGFIFRIVIAIPLGYSLTGLLANDVGVPAAFLLGAFPTNDLLSLVRRKIVKRFDIEETKDTAEKELMDLQGVNTKHYERFRDENINSILQIAYADPIDLSIRTNLNFAFIMDLKSQALLWIYVEKNIDLFREFSLRGAQEVSSLMEAAKGRAHPEASAEINAQAKLEADKTIDCLAKCLSQKLKDDFKKEHQCEIGIDIERECLLQILEQVAFDPHTEFLVLLW